MFFQDPEGTHLRYEKVSGALPPGVHIDRNTGHVSGTAPDVDATYEFGIRVIDEQGKYADQTFTIDTRGDVDVTLFLPFIVLEHDGLFNKNSSTYLNVLFEILYTFLKLFKLTYFLYDTSKL